MMFDEAIKNEEEIAIHQDALDNISLFGMFFGLSKDDIEEIKECYKCSKEYEQLAEWLKELKQLIRERQRISDLSEDDEKAGSGNEIKNLLLKVLVIGIIYSKNREIIITSETVLAKNQKPTYNYCQNWGIKMQMEEVKE